MLATNTTTDILAITAVVGAMVGVATLAYGFMRDHQSRAREQRDATAIQAEKNTEIIDRIEDDLHRLTDTVVGRPASNGYPATEGFMQDHARRLADLEHAMTP